MKPVEGSIQWAMDRGSLFHVDGVSKYGQLTTRSDNPLDAARTVLYRCAEYCIWVPNGTRLTVWNVYAGGLGGFSMKNAETFTVRNGEVLPC